MAKKMMEKKGLLAMHFNTANDFRERKKDADKDAQKGRGDVMGRRAWGCACAQRTRNAPRHWLAKTSLTCQRRRRRGFFRHAKVMQSMRRIMNMSRVHAADRWVGWHVRLGVKANLRDLRLCTSRYG